MDYSPLQDAPLSVKILREITSKQTIMFLIVFGFLVFAAGSLIKVGSIEPIETPFMLIVGYFFGESSQLPSTAIAQRFTAQQAAKNGDSSA